MLQQLRRGVPQVLGGQRPQQGLPQGVGVPGQKGMDLCKVAPRLPQQVFTAGTAPGLLRVVETRQPFLPQPVAPGADPGARLLLRPGQRDGRDGRWGAEGKFRPALRRVLRRGQRQNGPVLRRAAAERFGIPSVPDGGGVHVPDPQLHLYAPARIRLQLGDGDQAGLVQDLQGHLRTGLGAEGVGLHRGVAGGLIMPHRLPLPVQRRAVELCVLRRAEGAAVHQHGPGGGGVEPAPVQHRLRLAGAQKTPAAMAQHLYPGVVVVAVGPAGGVHLPGGQAHAAQRGHQKGRFLPAASASAAEHGQRRGGPPVLCLVRSVLLAPAVDLLHRLLLVQAPDPLPQQGMEQGAVVGQILVIDPGTEDILLIRLLAQRGAPGHGAPQAGGVLCQRLHQGAGIGRPILRQGRLQEGQFIHGITPYIRAMISQNTVVE